MENKIIIDGINVSECEYSFKHFDNWIGKDVVSCDYTLNFRCEPKANCCKFYMDYLEKQLKRAEQKFKKIEKYCEEQNLKADTTACEILAIIEGR